MQHEIRAASARGGVSLFRPAQGMARKRADPALAALGWLAVPSPKLARPACGSAAPAGSFGRGQA